jgi:hypothetical protein
MLLRAAERRSRMSITVERVMGPVKRVEVKSMFDKVIVVRPYDAEYISAKIYWGDGLHKDSTPEGLFLKQDLRDLMDLVDEMEGEV